MDAPQIFTLTLDGKDVNIIAQALAELPLKMSKATFDKIESQIAAAMQPTIIPPDDAAGGTD